MGREKGELVVRQAASGVRIDAGSPLHVRWDLERKHLEATIRATLAEFDQRAKPSSGTSEFLAAEAIELLSKWSREESRLHRYGDGRIDPQEMHACDQNLEWLALHLETVAATEARVLSTSSKFYMGSGGADVSMLFNREVQIDQQLPDGYESIVRGESLKRGLEARTIEQTGPGLFLQIWVTEPAIANKPDLAERAVDDLLACLPSVLGRGRMRTPSGDTYVIGQAGAVGPHARANNVVIQSSAGEPDVDLSELADELAKLRAELRKVSETLEHDEEIGALATAEKAARSGDRSRVLSTLTKVGTVLWEKAAPLGLEILADFARRWIGVSGGPKP